MCATFTDVNTDAFFHEWLLSGQSQFPEFLAFFLLFVSFVPLTAFNSNLPPMRMANFWKALNAKLMFIGLKICSGQSEPAIQFSPKMASSDAHTIRKHQQTIKLYEPSAIDCVSNELAHSFTSWFPYFLETFCPYFEKCARISILLANFQTNMVKYRQVGRSVTVLLSSHLSNIIKYWYSLGNFMPHNKEGPP